MIKLKRISLLIVIFIIISFITNSFFINAKQDENTKHHEDTSVYDEHKEIIESRHDIEISKTSAADEHHAVSHDTEQNKHIEHEEHSGGHHGPDLSPLLFVIIALIIGAATRHLLSGFFLPYTASLLIIGIILGIVNRAGIFAGGLEPLGNAIEWAGHIDPHVILVVFLPILIFEAAFAMDDYTFKKISTNAFLLAVPGILMALFLTGALVIGLDILNLGIHNWGWGIALMFGAVISATDPVAVVALLKELGASKKLGTLIEGESLLNDGTAIVIFMVFYLSLIGTEAALPPVLQFLWVSIGGILLGIIIGILTISWVRKVFNDALVEISVIVAAAYLTFFIAENFLGVSGVLGLVAFGLSMAGRGRTRISPEVEHFLHEFLELAAFIANTLIFIIVGMVIAQRTQFTGKDFIILGILYIGIHIVRAIVIAIHYPVMKRAGYGLPKKDAYVLWYGALRGAIGLALALVVAGVPDEYIPKEIKDQFLFLTAGIVTLTLLINATTIKSLVNKLGLTKIPPAKALMIKNANQYITQAIKNTRERMKTDRFMGNADWDEVNKFLFREGEVEYEGEMKVDTMAETRRRILEKEKSSYWHQFKEGLIGAHAVRSLTEQIKEILDEGGSLSLADRLDLEELWKTPKLFDKLQGWPILGKLIENFFFERLSVSYDSARGFIEAQEEVLKLVESMHASMAKEDKKEEMAQLSEIESEINENKIHGLTFLRILKKNYPEIYDAISTRQAIRSLLNHELKTVERLHSNGRIESSEMAKMVSSIEERMKRLMERPPKVKLPSIDETLWEIPWLHDLDPVQFHKAVGYFHKRVFTVGEDIIKAGTPADSVFIIVRGTARVSSGEEVKALLGPGTTLGEMEVLTEQPRMLTVTAVSPVTALRVKYIKIVKLMNEATIVKTRLWEIAGIRLAQNILEKMEPYKSMPPKQLQSFIKKGEVIVAGDEEIDIKDHVGILLDGKAYESGKTKKTDIIAPNILSDTKYKFTKGAHLFLTSKPKI